MNVFLHKMHAVINSPVIVFGNYVQIEDCRTRYNGDADHHQRRKKFTFPARLICGDCFEVISFLKYHFLYLVMPGGLVQVVKDWEVCGRSQV